MSPGQDTYTMGVLVGVFGGIALSIVASFISAWRRRP